MTLRNRRNKNSRIARRIIGLKTEAELVELKKHGAGFGRASCDACHTRHTFSKKEAQQPQACQTCHFKDGLLPKPASYAYPFPDLLTFHDAPTVIEQRLFVMFLEHRMRTFQGTFHANPDYALWYGWSEMQRDLTEIKTKAAELRAGAEKPGQ